MEISSEGRSPEEQTLTQDGTDFSKVENYKNSSSDKQLLTIIGRSLSNIGDDLNQKYDNWVLKFIRKWLGMN